MATMPAQSTLNEEDKAKVKKAIPKDLNKIFYATLARIYYAYPEPDKWAYSGLQGALAFILDGRGIPCFKMVDLEGTRGVIWEHEIYKDMEYNPDRAFFHSFPGDVRVKLPWFTAA